MAMQRPFPVICVFVVGVELVSHPAIRPAAHATSTISETSIQVSNTVG
jgi:hypothetical protein